MVLAVKSVIAIVASTGRGGLLVVTGKGLRVHPA